MGSECKTIPRANRECINKEKCLTLVGSKCRAEPTGKEGVHLNRSGPQLGGVRVQNYPTSKEGVQQRVVLDSGGVKSAELSPRAKRECINKEWGQTLVGSRVQR